MLDHLLPIDPEVAARIEALDLEFNEFGIDPYGIDKRDLIRFVSAFAWIYRYYFKVDVYGIGNVLSRGRAVLVGNHSGGVAIDGAMVVGSMLLDADPPRMAHAMLDKFIHKFPGALTSKNSKLKGKVWLLTATERNVRRYREAGRFSNAPDTKQQKDLALTKAAEIPVLMLLRQNGTEEQQWRGLPFWWPVIMTPRSAATTVFSTDEAVAPTATASAGVDRSLVTEETA